MSDREGGVGAFVLGVAIGAVLGLFFAPGTGEDTRAKLARRVRDLRDVAEDKAEDIRALVAGDDADEEDDPGTDREELRERLSETRRRRRAARASRAGGASRKQDGAAGAGTGTEGEDTPGA